MSPQSRVHLLAQACIFATSAAHSDSSSSLTSSQASFCTHCIMSVAHYYQHRRLQEQPRRAHPGSITPLRWNVSCIEDSCGKVVAIAWHSIRLMGRNLHHAHPCHNGATACHFKFVTAAMSKGVMFCGCSNRSMLRSTSSINQLTQTVVGSCWLACTLKDCSSQAQEEWKRSWVWQVSQAKKLPWQLLLLCTGRPRRCSSSNSSRSSNNCLQNL